VESLQRCCDTVNQRGIVAQMAAQTRSYPTSTGCRELLRSGQLGKISRVEQRRNGARPYRYSWMERAEPILAKDVDWKEFLMDHPMRPFDGKLLR
jgi:predicted dehydrogenase